MQKLNKQLRRGQSAKQPVLRVELVRTPSRNSTKTQLPKKNLDVDSLIQVVRIAFQQDYSVRALSREWIAQILHIEQMAAEAHHRPLQREASLLLAIYLYLQGFLQSAFKFGFKAGWLSLQTGSSTCITCLLAKKIRTEKCIKNSTLKKTDVFLRRREQYEPLLQGWVKRLLEDVDWHQQLLEWNNPFLDQFIPIRCETNGIQSVQSKRVIVHYSSIRHALIFKIVMDHDQHKKILLDSSAVGDLVPRSEWMYLVASHLALCLRLLRGKIVWMKGGQGLCGRVHGHAFRVEVREGLKILTFQ